MSEITANERLSAALNYAANHVRKRYVYFIKCHDFVKVGIAHDVFMRLSMMQTGCPYKLELIHYYACPDAAAAERELHDLYGKHWERGEWFKLPVEEIAALQRKEVAMRPKPIPKPPQPKLVKQIAKPRMLPTYPIGSYYSDASRLVGS